MNKLSINRPVALLLAGLLLTPAVAMAADPMPQLDFGNKLLLSQVVWGALIFIVLYILASKLALPKVAEVLDMRATHIARDLDGARDAKVRADAGMAEAVDTTAKARSEAQTSINTAMTEAKAKAAAQALAENTRLEQRLHEAEAQIAQARAAAIRALRQVATETTATIVARLTGADPDARILDSAVGSALSAHGVG